MNLTVGEAKASRLSSIKRCLRQPLLHFLLGGFALFMLYGGLQRSTVNQDPQRIEITPEVVQRIAISWLARWQRSPSELQMQGLIDEYVKEEILYREALKLGLDKDDTIIRRRLAQKMDFLAEDVASLREPAPGVLETWYQQHQEQYAPPPLATFHHVFFAADKRGANAQADALAALSRLTDKNSGAGDGFLFKNAYTEQSQDQVARVFGSTFALSLFKQTPGRWVGPVESGFGWHLLWIDALATPPAPPFETVAQQVKSDWLSEQRSASKRSSFDALKARYEVVMMVPAADGAIAATQAERQQ
ncbi:peptidylprolyl isomerase [Pseudomonas sp. Sample_24]|uniref:peptidylprolyl isomerase n=1 Tax=Pseudomonas sp. Sample_24 TaxID=2448268 RepID=UPI001032C384|nr:peptidylprolyl isomerase [Pseudomonas sp. Sample_24]